MCSAEYQKIWRAKNKDKSKEYMARYRLKNREKLIEQRKLKTAELKQNPIAHENMKEKWRQERKKRRDEGKVTYQTQKSWKEALKVNNPEKYELFRQRRSEKNKKIRLKLKIEVMSKYGAICQCCRESRIELLTIDHIKNNGAAHRREINIRGGHEFYLYLKKQLYPEGYQVLCWGCNSSKGMYGYCPHQRERDNQDYCI